MNRIKSTVEFYRVASNMSFNSVLVSLFVSYCLLSAVCIGQPSGHGAYEVQSIEATQTNNQSAGSRKSSSKLKIVKPDSGKASASVKVSGSNAKPEDLPTWGGEGLKPPTIGKETVQWEWNSISTTTVKASDESSEASVDIEISASDENTVKADTTKFQPWLDKTNKFIKSINETTANIAFTGEITFKTKFVDFYNNGESIGKYASMGGSLKLQGQMGIVWVNGSNWKNCARGDW